MSDGPPPATGSVTPQDEPSAGASRGVEPDGQPPAVQGEPPAVQGEPPAIPAPPSALRPGPPREHYYGGQAVLEGVMMRGREHWAVAIRRPDGSIHLESHEVRSIGKRYPFLTKPGIRGILALGQALSIGVRALTVSANQSVEDDEQLTPKQMAASMAFAFVLFLAVFVVGPYLGFRLLRNSVQSGIVRNLLEGVGRVLLFLGYIALIGRMREIRRVFMYHGAEHKTIAAHEHDDPLVPEVVDRYSTLHVRCGTNFLLIVMVLTILVYAVFPARGILWGIASRLIAIPLIAGLSFEVLRLGARYSRSPVMKVLMAPGLGLQKITTRKPDHGQIEVAVTAFEEVLRREAEAVALIEPVAVPLTVPEGGPEPPGAVEGAVDETPDEAVEEAVDETPDEAVDEAVQGAVEDSDQRAREDA